MLTCENNNELYGSEEVNMSYPEGYIELGFDLPNQFASSFTLFLAQQDLVNLSFMETVSASKQSKDGKVEDTTISKHVARLMLPKETIENLHKALGKCIEEMNKT